VDWRRARLDWILQIPICGLRLQIPYAFQNGVWNLVKPYRFSSEEGPAMGTAMRLAVEGDLLSKHGKDDQGEKKLIIIPAFENKDLPQTLKTKVTQVLAEYNVDTIAENNLPDFLRHVEETAHFFQPASQGAS
jgi:hypothetical protein